LHTIDVVEAEATSCLLTNSNEPLEIRLDRSVDQTQLDCTNFAGWMMVSKLSRALDVCQNWSPLRFSDAVRPNFTKPNAS